MIRNQSSRRRPHRQSWAVFAVVRCFAFAVGLLGCVNVSEPGKVAPAAGSPTQITPIEGNGQFGRAGQPLPVTLVVRVLDSVDRPIAGAAVTFTVTLGNGTIDGAAATTNGIGVATSGTWTLGPATGTQQVVARVGERTFVFEADAALTCEDLCPATRLAFERAGRIVVANEDGTNATRIAAGHNPSWGPGGRIAYEQFGNIWTIGITDAAPIPVTNESGADDAYPAFSPDGARVAFYRFLNEEHQSYLVVTRAGNANGNADENEPAMWWPLGRLTWSPDGSRIAFTCQGISRSDICVVPSDGDGYPYNFSLIELVVDAWIDEDPAWSPDGQHIAFTTNRNATDGKSYIAVIGLDGNDFMRLATGTQPAWSSDGKRIVFVGDSGLQVINADGTGLRRITNDPRDTSPSWRR